MAFDFFKPRRESITFYNTAGGGMLSKPGTAESIADRWAAKSHLRKLMSEIRKIAHKLPNIKYRTLQTHEVKIALDEQAYVIKNLAPAIEYTAETYNTIAQVMSDIYDRLLHKILETKFIPTGEKFNINIPLRGGRKAEVTLVGAQTEPGARESGFFRPRAIKNDMNRAMINVRKSFDIVKKVNIGQKHLTPEKYKEIATSFQQRAKGARKINPEEKEYLKLGAWQKALILNFATAIYNITEEYDAVAFVEADIEKIIRYLIILNRQAVYDPKGPLLPPAPLIVHTETMLKYLQPLRGWLDIAFKDQNAFQNTIKIAIERIYKDPNVQLWQYKKFLYEVLENAYKWARTATVDQQRLLQNFTTDMGQLQELRGRLSARRPAGTLRSEIFKIK